MYLDLDRIVFTVLTLLGISIFLVIGAEFLTFSGAMPISFRPIIWAASIFNQTVTLLLLLLFAYKMPH